MRRFLNLTLIIGTMASVGAFVVEAQRVIVADKITKGRTNDEKVYEYVVPANEWVETSLNVYPNQEVMIHHFTSNERVYVKIGSFSDSRLQRAGTILPLYTSRNCSNDRGPNARVTYYCVQVERSSGIRFFVRNSTRVGVAVKNR
jgi:hypothetical protein